jgi:enoyl-CoA hydratase
MTLDAGRAPAPILEEARGRAAIVTLNRPAARNALSSELLGLLLTSLAAADADPGVDVIILTGTDPAFCAGLDLKELGTSGGDLFAVAGARLAGAGSHGPLPPLTKPVIGAINGAAITGGLELALNCDFLIASDRAEFADTHSKTGVMPGWGLTVLLPQAIGVRRAREMSFSGRRIDAAEALAWGLVNHVVAHEALLGYCLELAGDISKISNQSGVRQIRATYAAVAEDEAGWRREAEDAAAWFRTMVDPTGMTSDPRPPGDEDAP